MQVSYTQAKIQTLSVEGMRTAYRRIGTSEGTPILFLNHLAASMDGADPMLLDALAEHFPVIAFDYQGIGCSGGEAPLSVEQMARETITFVRGLGHTRVHLLGLSLGGFVAQAMLRLAPELISSVILAGTGPAGDAGIARVPRITYYDMLRGALTGRDARYYLFFPQTKEARLRGEAFIARTKGFVDPDQPTKVKTLRRQLRAVVGWAKSAPQDLSEVSQRVWVVNGDHDRMVSTSGSYDMARRLPHATLTIYEGAGHGAIFQEPDRFIQQATAFYRANDSQQASK
ncbi:hydrolase, alpha/beta domain protein [Porphyromonas sp. oral taxon 278 str. W7784]|uniref:alpha/beta fold hydrolase n=1 Tax=Porphyromonas sp. oral taxon 278 TaxID=712437 RepID=UPI0003AD01E7|nr:alpha/beta hydrolase [Porphyromonas sp. oral taxon 278]ERJ71352.1 hydrolase, alpha/beta domain protein [Porphyromonas sp. oral taxon 278 str. W7784]